MTELQMLTQDEVAELLNVHRDTVAMFREIGILKFIKTGKNYMFSQAAIKKFQHDYEGCDVSNRVKAIEAYNKVKEKVVATNNDSK